MRRPTAGHRAARSGYLYLAGTGNDAPLRRAHSVQKACGADVALFGRNDLGQRFGWLNTSDLALGSLGLSGEGWFDGYTLLTAFARKAREQGAHYLKGEVCGFAIEDHRVAEVIMADGSHIGCAQVVNAAGPWARRIAAMAGVELPVFARRRTVYVISCPTALQPFPLPIDPTGFWIRPEAAGSSPDFRRPTTATISRCSRTTRHSKITYGRRSPIAFPHSRRPGSNVRGPATSR